jgi:hypothetical protein
MERSREKSSRETPARLPRPKRKREDLPENQLTAQVVRYLQALGWTVVRQNSGLFARPYDPESRIRIGEKGAADWFAYRPLRDAGRVEFFFFELKAPGKKPRPEQVLWLGARMRTGTLAAWFDDFDFGGSASFVPWLRQHFGRSPGDAPGIGL